MSYEVCKECKPSPLEDEVKKLRGIRSTSGNSEEILNAQRRNEYITETDNMDVAKEINNYFLPQWLNLLILLRNIIKICYLVYLINSTVTNCYWRRFIKKLSTLNPRKPAHSPDGIPAWVLERNIDLLELLGKEILNYRECRVPQSCKEDDIITIPEKKTLPTIITYGRYL